jgi:hypothetical protein
MSALQHRVIRSTATALCLGTALALAALPATAKPDPGPPVERQPAIHSCSLERVGTQFVRCDDLTGNGAPAPLWIPER